ncbi:hypothetical protein [Microtetraspora malaysiensis]|uniref:hypothetical protein n=1 Tax=Microtetraspora malaysiensis TaxID=161358 RepID=UPI003D8FC6B2
MRRTVGQSVNSVPRTARPIQPSTFTSACAACRRSCASLGAIRAIRRPPSRPPAASAAPAATYQGTTWANGPGSARRRIRSRTAVCQTTTATTTLAPDAAAHHGPSAAPTSTTAAPAFAVPSRAALHRWSGGRACSRVTVKCSLQIRIALVTAPSRKR